MQFFNKIGDVSVRPYLKGSFLWLSASCCFFCSVHGWARFGSSCPETVPTCVGIAALSHGIEDKQIHSCSVKQVLKWISSLCSSVSRYPPRLLFLVFPSLQLSVEESAAYFLCSSSSSSSSSLSCSSSCSLSSSSSPSSYHYYYYCLKHHVYLKFILHL